MNTQTKIELGSLIHATLRSEDLLPAFLHALEDYNHPKAGVFNSELRESEAYQWLVANYAEKI